MFGQIGKYIGKRLILLIPVLLGVSILIFTIMYFCPGDPARIMLGGLATEEQLQAARQDLGLDQSFFVQYFSYMKNLVLKFDLGNSYVNGQSVMKEIASRAPYTLRVAFISLVISIIIGIPLGVIAATNQYTWKDSLSMLLSMIFVSMPSFWLALTLVLVFSVILGILPSFGIENWTSYIMPCFALSVGTAASLARQTRSSMLEVIRQDFIVTSRAKGVKESTVIYKHALKNALIPIITTIGDKLGTMLAGALIAETVFAIPGMGIYIMNAINSRDYPVIRGTALVVSVWFCICMLIVDIIYAMVDPRIRSRFSKMGG